jgi:hypothetical protein
MPSIPNTKVSPMWWWQKDRKADNEKTREIRGTLASKVIELDNQTRRLEELMKTMLSERSKDAH